MKFIVLEAVGCDFDPYVQIEGDFNTLDEVRDVIVETMRYRPLSQFRVYDVLP
jgi:hypothetical protein